MTMTPGKGSAMMLVLLIVAASLQANVAAARRLGADDKEQPAAAAEAQVSGMKASPVSGHSDCTFNPNAPPTGPCPPPPSKS
jgi:hypothetical protein